METLMEEINYPENEKIINRIKNEIVMNLGSEAWEQINTTIEVPNASMSDEQLCNATYQLVDQFDQMADNKTANKVFSKVCHGLKREDFRWVREIFLHYNDIDSFAKDVRKDRMNELREYLISGELFYGQPIDSEVYNYINSIEDIFYGKRYGNKIVTTAIPFHTKNFLHASHPLEKRYHLCHCQFAKESILWDKTVSKTICYCSLGHTKIFWEAALDTSLEGNVICSALGGDLACRFEIYLPENIMKNNVRTQ